MPETIFSESHGDHRFQVVLNDLLSEPVDCIVNAANGTLSHGGGIAAAIAAAAGPRMEADCARIIENIGLIPVGHAAITSAGDLPYRAVIHAVGPRMGEGDEEAKLIAALKDAFALAGSRGYASLSFPAVSSGIFAVPAALCARAYHRAVAEYFRETPLSSLRLIRLCLVEGPVLDEVRTRHQNDA